MWRGALGRVRCVCGGVWRHRSIGIASAIDFEKHSFLKFVLEIVTPGFVKSRNSLKIDLLNYILGSSFNIKQRRIFPRARAARARAQRARAV